MEGPARTRKDGYSPSRWSSSPLSPAGRTPAPVRRIGPRVQTIHAFQGREADIVIVSLVRNKVRGGGSTVEKLRPPQSPRPHQRDVSRARRLLVVVGDWEHYANYEAEDDFWRRSASASTPRAHRQSRTDVVSLEADERSRDRPRACEVVRCKCASASATPVSPMEEMVLRAVHAGLNEVGALEQRLRLGRRIVRRPRVRPVAPRLPHRGPPSRDSRRLRQGGGLRGGDDMTRLGGAEAVQEPCDLMIDKLTLRVLPARGAPETTPPPDVRSCRGGAWASRTCRSTACCTR